MLRRITPDRPFKILGFTDMHISGSSESDRWALRLLRETVESEEPDLILFVGDNVAGTARCIRKFSEFITELRVAWCPVLGNHEGEDPYDTSREETVFVFMESPYCLIPAEKTKTADGRVLPGHTNYAVPLYNHKGKVCHKLIFLDGGNEMSPADKKRLGFEHPPRFAYNFLQEEQITWYREEMQKDDCSSMVFCHIPLPEFRDAAANGEFLKGEMRESICSSLHNSGMFEAMREEGKSIAYVAGHDHVNDFHALHKGIRLMYNRASGLSAYNAVSQCGRDRAMLGCTVYTIDIDGKVSFSDIFYEDYFPQYRDTIYRVMRK